MSPYSRVPLLERSSRETVLPLGHRLGVPPPRTVLRHRVQVLPLRISPGVSRDTKWSLKIRRRRSFRTFQLIPSPVWNEKSLGVGTGGLIHPLHPREYPPESPIPSLESYLLGIDVTHWTLYLQRKEWKKERKEWKKFG